MLILCILAANRDCFTDSEVFHLTRLFDTCPYFSTDKSGTIVVLQPKVIFKIIVNNLSKYLFKDYNETTYW
jgi:hypothetical protein